MTKPDLIWFRFKNIMHKSIDLIVYYNKMNTKLLILFIVCVFSYTYASTSSTSSTTFDNGKPIYYVFAVKKCNLSETEFSIHGLWPQFNRTFWPAFCNNKTVLDLKKIEHLIPLMNKVWYSCEGNNTGFWQHELLKHGSCSNMDQEIYFRETLNLYKTYPWRKHCNKLENATQCLTPLR